MNAPGGTFWIGPSHPFDLSEAYLNFRADLVLDAVPPQALLHISADSRYRLWVNGTFVGRGPERSWPSSMAVDERPVGHLLRPGVNRIAVQVYSPGYSHFAHVHRAACGMIGWLTAGDAVLLRSDTAWRCQRDLSWRAQVPRVSIYGTGVEDRDMARDTGWQEDAVDWPAARIVQPPEGPIWASLRPRRTPLPVEETRSLDTPFAVALAPRSRMATTPTQTCARSLRGQISFKEIVSKPLKATTPNFREFRPLPATCGSTSSTSAKAAPALPRPRSQPPEASAS